MHVVLDRTEVSNELFRFSTTAQQWEQLDGLQVSGSPPSARHGHGMAAVGLDLYVFGGTAGSVQEGSNELFRFSTTANQWYQLDVHIEGQHGVTGSMLSEESSSPPCKRQYLGMAAVGIELYLFGGKMECDSYISDFMVYVTPRVFAWPASGFSLAWLSRVYDDDIIHITGDADWPSGLTVELCSLAILPCFLTITGDPSTSSTILRHTDGGIICAAASGCTGVTMRNVTVACTSEASGTGPLQISGAGALATIEGAIFSDCVSVADGGSVRAYNGATVKIFGTTFQRSSSQVPCPSRDCPTSVTFLLPSTWKTYVH